jgi:hypothetical protein
MELSGERSFMILRVFHFVKEAKQEQFGEVNNGLNKGLFFDVSRKIFPTSQSEKGAP